MSSATSQIKAADREEKGEKSSERGTFCSVLGISTSSQDREREREKEKAKGERAARQTS